VENGLALIRKYLDGHRFEPVERQAIRDGAALEKWRAGQLSLAVVPERLAVRLPVGE